MVDIEIELGHYEEARQNLLNILGLRPDDQQLRSRLDGFTRKIESGR